MRERSAVGLVPWYSPTLSLSLSRVVSSLGRRIEIPSGKELHGSSLRYRVIFIQGGVLAQASVSTGNDPFQISLAGSGSFGILPDESGAPVRCWAVTPCVVYSVIPEVLYKVADFDAELNQELSSYSRRRSLCERLGQMICHVSDLPRRLGVFLAVSAGEAALEKDTDMPGWIRLPRLPPRRLVASILSCSISTLDRLLREWSQQRRFRHVNGALWVRRSDMLEAWQWLRPFLDMQRELDQATQSVSFKRLGSLDVYLDDRRTANPSKTGDNSPE